MLAGEATSQVGTSSKQIDEYTLRQAKGTPSVDAIKSLVFLMTSLLVSVRR